MRYYIALLHKDPKSDYGVSFPDLPGCITAGRTLDEARKNGYVRTLFGRVRPIPDINSKNPSARSAAERTAVNTPIQGSAADLVKRAMLLVDAALRGKYQARMLLQVHDELVLEAPPAEVEAVAPIVKAQMSKAADLAVPLVVELGSGKTWGAAH